MKLLSFILTMSTTLMFTGCYDNISPYKVTHNHIIPMGGGNPEVKLNKCLDKKSKNRDICIDLFYPEDIEIGIYPPNGLRIKLAGRASSIERREIQIDSQDRIILSIDTSNIRLPIILNVKGKQLQYKNSLAIVIEVKNIKDTITLKDKEGKLLLDYTIIK